MEDVSIRSSELIPSPLPWRAPWGAAVLSALVAWLCFVSSAVLAQSAAHPSSEPTFSSGYKFTQMTGRDLFANICQGCHMPDGEGASGAGTYPSIARNKNLEASGYPVHVVVNGQRAMPPFGAMLSVRYPIPNSAFPIAQAVKVAGNAETFYVSGQVPPVLSKEADPASPQAYGDVKTQTQQDQGHP
jgi:mono/diheme cytochrome c family protein